MEFFLKINMDNAAFEHCSEAKAALIRLLDETKQTLEAGQFQGTLRDVNDNQVGRFAVDTQQVQGEKIKGKEQIGDTKVMFARWSAEPIRSMTLESIGEYDTVTVSCQFSDGTVVYRSLGLFERAADIPQWIWNYLNK